MKSLWKCALGGLALMLICGFAPAPNSLVVVANLAALRNTSTAGSSGVVMRITDGLAGAPPMYFVPETGSCAIDDGASCVDSSNADHHWKGVFGTRVDARQWSVAAGSGEDQGQKLQRAIDAVAARGGGIVEVPAGQYTQESQVVIKRHVRLQCVDNGNNFGWKEKLSMDNVGTIFNVKWGSGPGSSNNFADADMQLQTGSTIDRCGFYYPNQKYTGNAPIEYGATILAYDTRIQWANNSQTATNNFCFNCYSFLDFRGSVAGAGHQDYLGWVSNARIEHNWGAPIAYGLRINKVNDWGYYDYNIFHAGAFGLGDPNFLISVPSWTIKNGIAFELDNSDWLNLSHEQEWGYANGVVILFTGVSYSSGGPVWITDSQFDACYLACINNSGGTATTNLQELRIQGNVFAPFDTTKTCPPCYSPQKNGSAFYASRYAKIGVLKFQDNHIFAPANYIIYADGSEITDAIVTGNTYSNATSASSIAIKGGYALTFGNLITLIVRDNIFQSFHGVARMSGAVTNMAITNNFTQ